MSEHDRVNELQKKSDISRSNSSGKIDLQRSSHQVDIIQGAGINLQSLTYTDVMQLQKTIGNQAVCQLMQEIDLMNCKPVQRVELPQKEEEILQMKQENNTGMPDQLKAGVENLSDIDMSDVRVHYNSDKPAQIGALAYTQGTDIHVAPGQEKHLPHEAWHVVQQAQGRVRPTMQLKGVGVNDDAGLESEADEMGRKALQEKTASDYVIQQTEMVSGENANHDLTSSIISNSTVQCVFEFTSEGVRYFFGKCFVDNHAAEDSEEASSKCIKIFNKRNDSQPVTVIYEYDSDNVNVLPKAYGGYDFSIDIDVAGWVTYDGKSTSEIGSAVLSGYIEKDTKDRRITHIKDSNI